ncbi:MAG: RDD family protein, partial [Bacillota bacterium]
TGTAAFDAAIERAVAAAVGIWGLVHMAYFSLFTGFYGQTPGKLLLGLAVAGPDGGPPGLARALLREVAGRILASLPLGLGYFWALGSGAGWHDMLAKTYVVSAERSLRKGDEA